MINTSKLKRYFFYLIQDKKYNLYLMYFSVFTIFLFGIIPLVTTNYEKILLIRDLKTYINQSINKISFLSNAQIEIEDLQPSIRYYKRIMPENDQLPEYISLLDPIVTYNGFFIDDVATLKNEESSSVDITLTLYGYGDLSLLIKEIESLNRVSQIKDISISNVKNRLRIKLLLTIYHQWTLKFINIT